MIGDPLLGWIMRFTFRRTYSRLLFSRRFLTISLATRKTFEMVFRSSCPDWGFRSNVKPKVKLVLNLIIIM